MKNSIRILLVEDHDDSAKCLARILCQRGDVVTIASNAGEARAAAAAQTFDVMICDIGLPDGNGSDLMREFSDKYRFPGIALTGFGMPGELESCNRAGFASIMIKPVEFDKLLAVLDEVAPASRDVVVANTAEARAVAARPIV